MLRLHAKSAMRSQKANRFPEPVAAIQSRRLVLRMLRLRATSAMHRTKPNDPPGKPMGFNPAGSSCGSLGFLLLRRKNAYRAPLTC
jgi:hypothetical protein